MGIYEIGILIRFFSLICILYNKSHLLILFLYFELIFLGNYILIKILLYYVRGQEGILIIYLIIGVAEGVMGLGLLVYLLRVSGKDYYLMLNITS